jgi:hypothetical protein
MRRFLLRAVCLACNTTEKSVPVAVAERESPWNGVVRGLNQLQIYHTALADAASDSLPCALSGRSSAFFVVAQEQRLTVCIPGLTAQKIFIYGIPDKITSWLAAPMIGGARLGWGHGGATVRTFAVAAEHRRSVQRPRCRFIWLGKLRVVNVRTRSISRARRKNI